MEEMRRVSQVYVCFGRVPELKLLIDLLCPQTELPNVSLPRSIQLRH